jgi:hypothetical protein
MSAAGHKPGIDLQAPVVRGKGSQRSASHAARCTARHGVGSHALPPTIE